MIHPHLKFYVVHYFDGYFVEGKYTDAPPHPEDAKKFWVRDEAVDIAETLTDGDVVCYYCHSAPWAEKETT